MHCWCVALLFAGLCLSTWAKDYKPQNPRPCVFSVGGSSYDLTPLRHETLGAPDYQVTDSSAQQTTVFMNVCNNVMTPPQVCKLILPSPGYKYNVQTCESMGDVTFPKASPNSDGTAGFTLEYSYGPGMTSAPKMEIVFKCDHGAGPGAATVTNCAMTAPDTVCHLAWSSEYACPTSNFGWGATFCIIFAAVVVVYLAGGTYYNRTTKGMRGMEAMPNRDFWRELPALVKEGTTFFFSKVGALSRKGGGKENL